jgi:putative PIN family toxin of toxin-antitoxin system
LVFLDSNVIFSGLHSPEGPPGAILRYLIEGKITVVVSQQVLEEVVRTFKKKLPRALPALREFLLNSPLKVVGDSEPNDIAQWADMMQEGDASILAASIAAEPDFFVTGDSHFLNNTRLKKKSTLVICSPSELIDNLSLEETT